MNTFARILSGGALFLMAAGPAHSEANPSSGAMITASVPLVCELDANDIYIDVNRNTAQGSVNEFCNGTSGFRVTASYRTLDSSEDVMVNYGGTLSQLDASGYAEVAYVPGPSMRTVPVNITSDGLASGLAITLGLTAL